MSDSDESTEMCTQYLPVVCTGLQPGSNAIVVGPELQFFTDGSAIPTENQQYIWIPEIMRKLQADKISAPLNTLPVVHHPLKRLLKGMRKITNDNFMSAMYMLGK